MTSETLEKNLANVYSASVPDEVKKSIYDDCRTEEDRFKWIESEKAGYDLGERAIQQWVYRHWSGYLRARWLEHLQGNCFWIELDSGDFGLLQKQFQDQLDLLVPIVERLKSGGENLTILHWATENQLPTLRVLTILETLDINSRRLRHRFES